MLKSPFSIFCKNLQESCTFISVVLNIYLIILIIYKSPKKIGNYKYLMIYICVFEILYTILGVLTKPYVHSYTSRVIVIVDVKNSMFSRSVNKILNSTSSVFLLFLSHRCLFLGLICGFYGCSVSIFAIHFMYRYGALDRNHQKYYKGWKMVLLCCIPIFYGIIWGLTMHFIFEEDKAFTEFIRKDIWDLFELPVEDIVYTGSYYYPEDKYGVKEMNWRAAGGMAVLWFVIGSSTLTVIYFGLSCYFKIRKIRKSTGGEFSKSLQRQLFRALVIQAAIPLLLLYIPCSVVFVCPLIQIDLGNMSAFISVSVAVYPAIDPLPTLIIIKNYRKATIEFFVKSVKLLRESPAASTSSLIQRFSKEKSSPENRH
ncbi:CBN-STR-178 protein [Caenorhabditis brenneri]|uniref:Serpentine receptor class r-10 n=1 Tax=Caenorhabditis brenneri TaxID=135651 RepID=G0MTY6_CAEBE|nr:CBN-STR-178 protein [Caenorhabditis brenneri]